MSGSLKNQNNAAALKRYTMPKTHGKRLPSRSVRLREGYIKDGIGYIPLTQNRWALCDAHNFHWLSQWNWYAFRHPANGRWYARRAITRSNRKETWAPMHRVVMGVTDPKIQIDHKDRSPEGGLDNRECNLRIATGAQNASNQGVRKNNASGCKGVAWHKATGKWMAYICVNGKQIHLASSVPLEPQRLPTTKPH